MTLAYKTFGLYNLILLNIFNDMKTKTLKFMKIIEKREHSTVLYWSRHNNNSGLLSTTRSAAADVLLKAYNSMAFY